MNAADDAKPPARRHNDTNVDALSRPLFATSTLSGSPPETINWSYDEPSITYGIGRLTAALNR